MLKGNHDYWWNSLKKLEEYKEMNFENIDFLHNNAYEVEGKIVARNERLGTCRRRSR